METKHNDRSLPNEYRLYKELRQIRKLLSDLIGTSDLPTKDKFSNDAISKAAKEFRKLNIERGEWITGYDLYSVIKHANHNSHKMIIEKFKFKNYFKRGNQYYFKKMDLIELNKELKKRKIHLDKYDELLRDKEKFDKYVNKINEEKGSKQRRRYKIPESLQNIFSKPYSPPKRVKML